MLTALTCLWKRSIPKSFPHVEQLQAWAATNSTKPFQQLAAASQAEEHEFHELRAPLPEYDPSIDLLFSKAFPLSQDSERYISRTPTLPESPFLFTTAHEDSAADVAVLKQLFEGTQARYSAKVLCIAGSGETPTALCSVPGVGEVHAVDYNAAQVELCRLRWNAMLNLTNSELLNMFAVNIDSEPSRALTDDLRVVLYEKLRGRLSAPSRDFWDSCADTEIRFGLAFSGRAYQYFDKLRQVRKSIGDPSLFCSQLWYEMSDFNMLNDIMQFPNEAATNLSKKWHPIGLPHSFAHLAKKAAAASSSQEEAVELLRQFHFPRLALEGTVGCGAALPVCYTEAVQRLVQRRVWGREVNLQCHQGDIYQVSEDLAGSRLFDVIALSNITDRAASLESAAEAVSKLLPSLCPYGHIILRTNISDGAPPSRILEAAGMRVDTQLTNLACSEENGLFGYGDRIAVAVNRKGDKEGAFHSQIFRSTGWPFT